MEYLKVAFILSAAINVFSKEFIEVHTSCRYWDKLDIYSNGGSEELHCILDQDKVPGIVYTEWILVPSGFCPVYNRHAKVIDCIPCNESIGDCPTELVKSYQAVLYTGCFQMPLVGKCVTAEMCTPPEYNHTKCMEKDVRLLITFSVLIVVLCIITTTLPGALIGTWIWIKKYKNQSRIEYGTIQDTITVLERQRDTVIR